MKKTSDHLTKGEETQSRILEEAKKLFIQRGFDGTTMREVAQKADSTKALVFHYFKNKQNLFDKILDSYYQAQAEGLMSSISGKGPLKKRIHRGIDAYMDFIEKNPGYPRLIQGEICSHSRNLKKITEHMKPLYHWGTLAFGEKLPQKGPLSPKHFFVTIFGMIVNYYTYSPVIERLWGKKNMSKSALAERREHIHLMVDGLLAKFLKKKRVD